jgi:hypothetical protein
MAEHTKTPWKIAGAVHIYSPGEGGGNVCSMSDPRVSTVVGYTDVALDSKDADEAYANAAFIVRCVNAHDDLVKALEAALATHGDQYSWGPIARDALAKAAS